jgi:hypothetical protein
MRAWTLALVIGFMFGGGCKRIEAPPWAGIPVTRSCDWDGDTATCIAENRMYTCVRDNSDGCARQASDPVSCAPRQ